MLLNGKIETDPNADLPPGMPSNAWIVGIVALCLMIYILFSSFGNAGLGTVMMSFIGVMIIVIKLRWELRRRLWFWIVVSVIVIVHFVVILLIPWPNKKFYAPIIILFAGWDFSLISYAIKLIARWRGEEGGKA
jgi:hypothetical protein